MKIKKALAIIAAAGTLLSFTACGMINNTSEVSTSETETTIVTEAVELVDYGSSNSEDLFTDRDLEQSPDLADATYITVKSGQDINIDSEGTYVISGDAEEVTIYVEAGDEDKVQLVLDGLSITNTDTPCIYVKSADKVFVTTSNESTLTVSGSFSADTDTNTDAVIFSKDDLVMNGTGTLNIVSSDNGITSKDSLKVTGGTINIECEGSALEAHDSIEIADGIIDISKCNDGLHAEDDDDDTIGYIYIGGGEITIVAVDDGIHATTTITIDDGNIDITAAEGIEATVIQVNGGNINISASDDGINASQKSNSYSPLFEMNGGYVTIKMGSGDTDGVDSNGDIVINGGTIDITGQSTFDYDGTAEYNGGTIIENGEETNTITNQFFGGQGGPGGQDGFGGPGGQGGQMPDGQAPDGQTPPDGQEGFGPQGGQTPPDGQAPQDGHGPQEGGPGRR